MDEQVSESPDRRIEGLIREARRGDLGAFDAIVREYQDRMYNLAFRMTNNREDASDLTQEIFLKAYRCLGKFRGESRFSTWLHAVAVNTCRSGMRKLRRIAWFEARSLDEPRTEDGGRSSFVPADPGDNPAEAAGRRELAGKIGAVVAALPAEFREVLVLRDVQGLSYEEIANAMGLTIGTVKSRLCRARFKAKEGLVGKNGDDVR